MNKYLYMSVGAFVVLIVLISASALYVTNERGSEADNSAVSAATLQEFIERTRAQVVQEIGQPIEGFEPFMFMRVYPGLTTDDFDGVEALIGGYRSENGQVTYDSRGEPELHSAARAIPDEGMATLLINVANRLNLNLDQDEGLDMVFEAIEEDSGQNAINERGPNIGERVGLEGEVVCLPHKDRDGPQTLECAFGLRTDDGLYYGLKNLFELGHYDIGTDERISVVGVVEAPHPSNIYDIVSVINIESVQRQ